MIFSAHLRNANPIPGGCFGIKDLVQSLIADRMFEVSLTREIRQAAHAVQDETRDLDLVKAGVIWRSVSLHPQRRR